MERHSVWYRGRGGGWNAIAFGTTAGNLAGTLFGLVPRVEGRNGGTKRNEVPASPRRVVPNAIPFHPRRAHRKAIPHHQAPLSKCGVKVFWFDAICAACWPYPQWTHSMQSYTGLVSTQVCGCGRPASKSKADEAKGIHVSYGAYALRRSWLVLEVSRTVRKMRGMGPRGREGQ